MSKNIEYKITDKKTTEELPPLDDTYYEPDTTVSLIKQQIKEYLSFLKFKKKQIL